MVKRGCSIALSHKSTALCKCVCVDFPLIFWTFPTRWIGRRSGTTGYRHNSCSRFGRLPWVFCRALGWISALRSLVDSVEFCVWKNYVYRGVYCFPFPLWTLTPRRVYGYGNSGGEIPEGYIDVTLPGDRQQKILHPAYPGSVYHTTK